MAPRNSEMIAEDSDPSLHHIATFDSQMMGDSSQLLSLPSQPPDIRIWFPSYEYGSPESDLDDGHLYQYFSGWKEEGFEGIGNKKDPNEDESAACRKAGKDSEQNSRPANKLASLTQETHLSTTKEALACLTSILVTRTNEDDLTQDFSLHRCNQNPEAVDGNSSTRDEFPQVKMGAKLTIDGGHLVSKTGGSSNKDDGNFEDHKEEELERHNFNEVADKCNAEEDGKAIANDGFRSTRSKKSAIENPGMIHATTESGRKIGGNSNVLNRNKLGKNSGLVVNENEELSVAERHGRAERRALLDRTNFHGREMTPEISGRWKCPQKGKPYIGPPMKQLRFECWVRRA